jgi:hypothetical protein
LPNGITAGFRFSAGRINDVVVRGNWFTGLGTVVPGASRAARFGTEEADEDDESQEGHGGVVLSGMRERDGVSGEGLTGMCANLTFQAIAG